MLKRWGLPLLVTMGLLLAIGGFAALASPGGPLDDPSSLLSDSPEDGDADETLVDVASDADDSQAGLDVAADSEDGDELDAADLDEEPDEDLEATEVCNSGPGTAGEFRLEIEGLQVEIDSGTVLSFATSTLTIDAPDLVSDIVVNVSGADVEGDLAAAAAALASGSTVEVRVEGTLQADGSVLADEVKVLCLEQEDEDADEDDDDEDGDVDDIDDDVDDGEGEG